MHMLRILKKLLKLHTHEACAEKSSYAQELNIQHDMQTSPSKKKKFEVEIYERIVHGEPPMDKVSLEKIRYD